MTVPKHFMNSAWAAKRFPELKYDNATQKDILEYVIAANTRSIDEPPNTSTP